MLLRDQTSHLAAAGEEVFASMRRSVQRASGRVALNDWNSLFHFTRSWKVSEGYTTAWRKTASPLALKKQELRAQLKKTSENMSKVHVFRSRHFVSHYSNLCFTSLTTLMTHGHPGENRTCEGQQRKCWAEQRKCWAEQRKCWAEVVWTLALTETLELSPAYA